MEKFAKIISVVAISLILIFGQLPTLRVLAVELPGETEKPTATETTNETEMPVATEQPGSNEEASESSATNQDETTNSGNQENQESTNEQESTNGQVGETTIETEDINTSGTIENDINTNLTGGSGNEDSGNTQITNEDNGTNSKNEGTIITEEENNITQENDADINNSLEIMGDSGGNSASENVGDSTIETGDVNITGTIVNFANTNASGVATSEFNIADDQTGDLVLDFAANCTFGCGVYDNDLAINNDGNGSGSTNEGTIEETNSNDITQENNINVENELILLANTGGNTADNNTGGDNTINTGNANVAGNVINFLDNNILGNVVYGVVNIFGNLIGDIILSEEQLQLNQNGNTSIGNTGNGTGSNNTGTIDQNEIINIDQLNDVAIINNIEVMADTGGNIATDNTGGNTSITSGDTNLDVNVTNIANNNVVGGTWWIVLVNQAGNWFGQILGAPEGQNFASLGADISSSNGTTNISNGGNGSGSTNEGNINQTNEKNIVQENNAAITNNIKLAATTGGNSTSRNTGGNNSITTGDANVMLNLVNFANNNFTGNVVVTVVNVFGSWFGDFVTPGSKQDNNQDNQIGPPPQQEDKTQNSGGNQITDSSGSSHNNSSDNGSPQSSTNPVSAAPAPETNTPANPGNTFPQAIVAGLQIKSNNPLELPIVQQTNSEKTSKTKINLAWLLLALPLFALLALAGRKTWMHKNQTEHRLGQ